MNFLTKVIAVIYQAYDYRGMDTPHFRTLLTIVFIAFIHLVHIGLVFNIPSNSIMPWSSSETKTLQWLYGSLYFDVPVGLVAIIFRKSKLDKIQVSQKQIDGGRKILPIYLIFFMALLTILLIRSCVERGKMQF